MRSSKFWLVGSILLSVLLTIGFLSCGGGDDGGGGTKSNKAELTSLGVTVDGTAKTVTKKDPITDWDTITVATLTDEQKGEVTLTATEKSTGVIAITTSVSAKAKVALAVKTGNAKPDAEDFLDPKTAPITSFATYSSLWIRVTAENGKAVNYYYVGILTSESNARLSSISVGGVQVSTSSDSAAKDSLNEAAENLIQIALTKDASANAAVVITKNNNSPNATVKIAKVAENGKDGAEAQMADYVEGTTKFDTIDDGDEIYVKVTSADGSVISYYGFTVAIGRDATLRSVTFDGQAVDELGTFSTTSLADATAGAILMAAPQPTAGFIVVVSQTDSEAQIVQFGKIVNNAIVVTNPNAQGNVVIKFNDEELLGVEVKSSNGKVTNYYKIRVELQPTMEIAYGTPKLYNTTAQTDTTYVDPIWTNDASPAWIPIAKQNRAETDAEFFADPSTKGHAKLLWDNDGLWLYVDIETEYISTEVGSAGDHDGSNVELFINEAYPTINSGNYNSIGGQYRVDSSNNVTGDPSDAATALRDSGKYKTWKTDKGYAVMLQAPWRFKDTYPLKDNKDISLEVQINAAGPTLNKRIGVLKWYNTTANTYQNASALAPGKLAPNPNAGAGEPVINTQPASETVIALNGVMSELEVKAESPNTDGVLSYQWYKATNAAGEGGTAVSGATNAKFTPTDSVAEETIYYYYVIVTNTKGGESKTKQSNVAAVRISDPNKALITFDSAGGSAVAGISVSKDTTMGGKYPTPPTKAGYIFDGWWDDTIGKEYFAETVVAADLALKAKWATGIVAGEDYIVPLTGQTVRNAEIITGGYAPMLTFPVGEVDITKYNASVIEAKFLDASGATVVPGWSTARQLVYGGDEGNGTVYNYGVSGASGQTIVRTGDVFKVTRSGWAVDGGTMPSVIKTVSINRTDNDSIAYVQILSITFKGIAPPRAPYTVDLAAASDAGAVFVDVSPTGPGEGDYKGISFNLKDTLPADFSIRGYNRVNVVVEVYSDAAGATPITGTNNGLFSVTLFTPWTDYTPEGFPAWGTPGRLAAGNAGVNASAATGADINIGIDTKPEGIRFERNGNGANAGGPLQSMKVISIKFWNTAYQP